MFIFCLEPLKGGRATLDHCHRTYSKCTLAFYHKLIFLQHCLKVQFIIQSISTSFSGQEAKIIKRLSLLRPSLIVFMMFRLQSFQKVLVLSCQSTDFFFYKRLRNKKNILVNVKWVFASFWGSHGCNLCSVSLSNC